MIDTAVILAAGRGKRLRESMGNDVPKPLQLIKGGPLITRVINNIRSTGIKNIHVVIGYKAELIMKYFSHVLVRTVYDNINLNFIYNPDYNLHSGISLLAAEETVAGKPFLCCMGDHLIEPGALRMLLRAYGKSPDSNYMLVDFERPGLRAVVHRPTREVIRVGGEGNAPRYCSLTSDVGAFVFASNSLTDIFYFIRKVQKVHIDNDCDLKNALDLIPPTYPLAFVDIYPWNWVNINNAEDIKQAEANSYLCP